MIAATQNPLTNSAVQLRGAQGRNGFTNQNRLLGPTVDLTLSIPSWSRQAASLLRLNKVWAEEIYPAFGDGHQDGHMSGGTLGRRIRVCLKKGRKAERQKG